MSPLGEDEKSNAGSEGDQDGYDRSLGSERATGGQIRTDQAADRQAQRVVTRCAGAYCSAFRRWLGRYL